MIYPGVRRLQYAGKDHVPGLALYLQNSPMHTTRNAKVSHLCPLRRRRRRRASKLRRNTHNRRDRERQGETEQTAECTRAQRGREKMEDVTQSERGRQKTKLEADIPKACCLHSISDSCISWRPRKRYCTALIAAEAYSHSTPSTERH